MAWVVDTCVIIDVVEDDPRFGERSARYLQSHLRQGLVVSPVTYVELAPVFGGSIELQEEFLTAAGVRFDEQWTPADSSVAHAAWSAYVRKRRKGAAPKRPLADVLIGALACRHDGLITRNEDDFARLFPDLHLGNPTAR